jgi:hypothetical protein
VRIAYFFISPENVESLPIFLTICSTL